MVSAPSQSTVRQRVERIRNHAITTHRVIYQEWPSMEAKGLPRLVIRVVLIARLAVDQRVRGQGLGAFLLVDVLRGSARISEQVGMRAMEVDALDDEDRSFYLKFGFRAFPRVR